MIFFVQLDAITKTQNPDAAEEVLRDITLELSQTLLNDATKDGFGESKTFEKNYSFNTASSDFRDLESYMNKVSVLLRSSFLIPLRLTLGNVESMISSDFKI